MSCNAPQNRRVKKEKQPAGSRLQREIKQTKPFPSLAAEAALSLLRTADALWRQATLLLEPHGLTPQQYNVLRILRGAGVAGLPTLEIGTRLIEETPGVTRLVDRLVEKGLVRRGRGPSDRRQVLCFATAEALDLLARLDDDVRHLDEAHLAPLGERRLRQLVDALDEIRERARSAGRPAED